MKLAALAIVLALLAAGPPALAEGYALVTPDGRSCAQTERACDKAIAAIRAGRSHLAAPDAPLSCVPDPSCFDARSRCIVGYNCGRKP